MKKNTIIKTGMLLLIFVIIGILLWFVLGSKEPNDEIKFKQEYENLNGEKTEGGKKYLDVEVEKENNVKYSSFDEVMDLLEEGTGILYLGFPECPWCRNVVPTLLKAAKDNEVSNIYYFNALSIRDTKELVDGKIKTTKKGTDEYYRLVEKLSDYLGTYEGLNDDTIKRIYFPTVVFVMGGDIVGVHIGTVDSQEDPYKGLTSKQEKELLKTYNDYINKMYGICDESC